jgi:hypothetical protein
MWSTATTTRLLRVRRRCLVCEAEVVAEEPETTFEIGSQCPSCSAPTERVEVLGSRVTRVDRNEHAAALGRLGGLRGGPARASALSPERRCEIAVAAARARWGKKNTR